MTEPYTVLVIYPDGIAEFRTVGEEDTLAELQSLVGGLIEPVVPPDGSWTGWVNEEGRLEGMMPNFPASIIARQHGWQGGILVGPMVFAGPGNDESVPESLIRYITGGEA